MATAEEYLAMSFEHDCEFVRGEILERGIEGQPAEVPSTPPIVAIEISSPDDRLQRTLEKLDEYRAWGIRHIWLVEQELRSLYVFDGSLNQTSTFVLPEHGIRIASADIFA